MRWNLRMVAAQRGVWKASDLRRALAEAGLAISVGKMSHLWSGTPISLRLDDLDVICTVLECTVDELLLPDPVPARNNESVQQQPAAGGTVRPVRRRGGSRSTPPV